MKINSHKCYNRFGNIYLLIIPACIALAPETALAVTDTISSGALTMNLDPNALAAAIDIHDTNTEPSMFLEDFFTAPQVDQMTFQDLLATDEQPTRQYPTTGLLYPVNGADVTNLTERHNQATTFTFDPNDIAGTASGEIGLDGVGRFRVDTGLATNRILIGDYALEYIAANENLTNGQSGWTLFNNIGYNTEAFDLFSVTTTLQQGELSISGNLGIGPGIVDMLNGTPDAIVGNFSFQTSVVPVPAPAAIWLFLIGISGLRVLGKHQGRIVV